MSINNNPKEFLWVEKYRPNKVEDIILPKGIKDKLQKFVDDKNVPNLLLEGPAGVGKTTAAKAMLDEIGSDYIIINGSMNGNIDTLRFDISSFASSVSFTGGRKYVILDEADYLNARSTQPALRNFMEEFSKNCGFILTCNFGNKIIEPLRSRCSRIKFNIPKEDSSKMAAAFFKRVKEILDNENVEYNQAAVAEVIKEYYPDWRRIINELQLYSATGNIDVGVIQAINFNSDFDKLFASLKSKDFSYMRNWVEENSDMETGFLYTKMYDQIPKMVKNDASIADAIILLAQYQYQETFSANKNINRASLLFELMGGLEWK